MDKEPHHFQKISECVSEVLSEEIKEENTSDFFILQAPRSISSVKNSIQNNINLKCDSTDIFIKNAGCPFFNDREVRLTESIMNFVLKTKFRKKSTRIYRQN